MKEKIVSVIVPIYNAEKYLEKCIESIRCQEYKEIEIILVNDGSTDKSGSICRDYLARDMRIRVIEQENRGNTAARRAGLTAAKGDYVAFVDADDYVGEQYISSMIEESIRTDADVVIANVTKKYNYGEFQESNKLKPGIYRNTRELVPDMFYYKDTYEFGILPYLFSKLYKKEFIIKGFKSVTNELQYAEDRAIMFWTIINAKVTVLSESNEYYYVIHEGSLCTATDEMYLAKLSYFFIYVKRLFEKQPEKKELLKQLDKYMVNGVLLGLNKKIGLYESNLIPKFYIPIGELPEGRNIVLYGAGNVGQDAYKQLQKNGNVKVVLWCDENYEKYRKEGIMVEPVDRIMQIKHDYILVAVLKEQMYLNITQRIKQYGIKEEQIQWVEPKRLF